ncbi:MAG: hypothetical protein GVY36_08010 [Verrucomicrobia bacterium]|jgi:hypothetical protein|nr:hypothetical protein [Verrucomicrobiota bacterium]
MESANNRYFETVGLDRRSVAYINELSHYIGERAARYVSRHDLEYPQPILVRLRPAATVDFEGDHRLRMGERSTVLLDLRWGADLNLERTCYLLCKALLVQYTVYNFGPGRAPTMRAWPIAALATDAYLGLRPAETLRVQQDLRGETMFSARSIFRLKAADGDAPCASAYWLVQSLRGLSPDGHSMRRFFKQGLSGIDVAEPLAIQLKKDTPRGPGIELEAWWASQRKAILARPVERFESMAASREWIEAVADLSSAELSAESDPINLRTLRKHKESEAVRELIAARHEILRLRIARCNPAFFNAAQSLGALFEAFLDGEPSHRYVHALVGYLRDIEDAKAMESAIGLKLSGE